MTKDITSAAKVALLKHLAGGKSADVVAAITGLPRDQVVDIASHHGYPDTDKLAWAADILEKAAARAEVERLEQQLAEAKAKLRGGKVPAKSKATTATDGPSAAEVRAWAAENHVECPAVGRVPGTVRDAYDTAHADTRRTA